MKLIENYDIKKVNKFLKSNNAYFMQTKEWIYFRESITSDNAFYLSLVHNNQVLGVAFILEKKLFKDIKYYYVPRGFVIDYEDFELVEAFTILLKNYAKENKSIFIKIDPDVLINKTIVNNLQKIGYKHFGYNLNFENNLPRYTHVLDLNKDIINNYDNSIKRIINRGNVYNLDINKNNVKIEDFYLTMKETEERENILFNDLNYYKNFYEYLNKHNMSDIYSVSFNRNEVENILNDEIKNINKKIEDIKNSNKYKDTKKRDNLIKELNNQLNRPSRILKELSKVDNNTTLSSVITVKYLDTVYIVHGGNRDLLRDLNSNYLLYNEIIMDAKENGFKYVDFFGTTGDDDINNPVYGIKLFKQRFGGDLTEYIGEFDLITNKPLYYIFKTFIPIYRNIKRKILMKK